jgi:hypothetical protein
MLGCRLSKLNMSHGQTDGTVQEAAHDASEQVSSAHQHLTFSLIAVTKFGLAGNIIMLVRRPTPLWSSMSVQDPDPQACPLRD